MERRIVRTRTIGQGWRAWWLLISCARAPRTQEWGGAAWSVLVLAERGTPDQSYFQGAVLVHARTFGLIQAAPITNEQASLEGSFISGARVGKGRGAARPL